MANDSSVGLSWGDFNYSAGNTVDLPGPNQYSDGLDKAQVTGIVIGCILGGLAFGALGMWVWLKRRRLFPARYGPAKHPDDIGAVHSIDVMRTGSKLDHLSKAELVTPKSFVSGPRPGLTEAEMMARRAAV